MSAKIAIAIELDELRLLMHEYIVEELNDDQSDNILRQMYLGHFLLWLKKRQESITKEQPSVSKETITANPTNHRLHTTE